MPYSGRNGVTYKEVRVAKAPLSTCLTCPLCNYLFREATTISECLHTFCKDCITAELSNGESECCPMCHVGLGTLPLEKLRADHQLNDLKEKLFPTNAKKRKPGLSIDSPGTSNATKRKERSLYSLGVKGTAAVNPGYANRKTRALPGTHGSSGPSSIDEELEDGGDDEDEDISDDSPSTILKLESRAVSTYNGGSRRSSPEEDPEAKVYPHSEPRRARANAEELTSTPRGDGEHLRASNSRPWTTSKVGHRLNLSVPNGNKSSGSREGSKNGRGARKNNGSSSSGRGGRAAEFPSALDALAQVANADAALEETGSGPPSPSPALELLSQVGGSKSNPGQRDSKEGVLGKGAWSPKDGVAATANGQSLQSRLKQTLNGVMERPSILRHNSRPLSGAAVGGQSSRSPSGIWFHLESGDIQANEDALPPLSSPYVRIKDGKLPVYHVKKYLVQKLAHKVKTEMEVEITCRGQPVVSSLPLESIRDIWFSAQISDQPQTQAQGQGQGQGQAQTQGETSSAAANGSSSSEFPSAKDFLMVLTYRRHRKPRINS